MVDHYDSDWTRLWYILISGTAQLIYESAEQERAVEILREKYPQYRAMELEGNPVIKITPERVTGLVRKLIKIGLP